MSIRQNHITKFGLNALDINQSCEIRVSDYDDTTYKLTLTHDEAYGAIIVTDIELSEEYDEDGFSFERKYAEEDIHPIKRCLDNPKTRYTETLVQPELSVVEVGEEFVLTAAYYNQGSSTPLTDGKLRSFLAFRDNNAHRHDPDYVREEPCLGTFDFSEVLSIRLLDEIF